MTLASVFAGPAGPFQLCFQGQFLSFCMHHESLTFCSVMNFGKRGNLASVETVNPQELYQTIVDASSQDPSRVHSSSTRLEQMSHMLGTIDALQEIAIQRSLPLPIRQQATIQFKNLVSASWRSRRYVCAMLNLL